MTIETFEKAQKLYKRIEDARYLIAEAKACDKLRIVCNGDEREGFNISKSTLEVIIKVLMREKEKWEKELEAL